MEEDKKPECLCTKCQKDIAKHCMATILPLLRVVEGQLVEVQTPALITPLTCPECGAAMLSMRAPSRVVTASPHIIRAS